MRLLLIGNYGVGNVGDELLKEYFLEHFPEVEWTVVTARPVTEREVPRLPFGLRSLFRPWWRTLGAMRRSEGVVFGGGTLFADTESIFACFLWGMYILFAGLFRRPVYLAFQGIGPFRSPVSRGWGRMALRSAAFVSVRDAASAARVTTLVPGIPLVPSFDPVVLLFPAPSGISSNALLIIPRYNAPLAFIMRAQQLWGTSQYPEARVISLQPDDAGEQKVCRTLAEVLPGAEIVSVRGRDDLIMALYGGAFVLTARYHGALAATALGIPFEVLSQGEGDKFEAFPMGMSVEELCVLAKKGEEALKAVLRKNVGT